MSFFNWYWDWRRRRARSRTDGCSHARTTEVEVGQSKSGPILGAKCLDCGVIDAPEVMEVEP